MQKLARAAFLVGVVLNAGCATNPITGDSELALVSEASTINDAAAAYRAQIDALRSAGRIVEVGAPVARVRYVTDRLVEQAKLLRPDVTAWAWEVQLIDEPDVRNAFCAPGGKMAIYTGLLSGLEPNDDELAQVMAHEVSHALLNHGREAASVGVLASVLQVMAAISGATAFDQDLRQAGAEIATDLMMELPTSRGSESEADRLGIELAARAGYDPQAAVVVWQKMLGQGGASASRFDFWSTHPATPKRIEMLSLMVDAMEPPYRAARAVREKESAANEGASAEVAAADRANALQDVCSVPSPVDRAQCLGLLELGMSRTEADRVLGAPNSVTQDGKWYRYTDRFLQFDSGGRLTRIADRPQE